MTWTGKYVASRKALYYTIKLIWNYYIDTGRKSFHYRKLRAYWDRTYMWKDSEWHTIERYIRELAKEGYLERIGRGKFKMTPKLEQLVREVREYLNTVKLA